MAKWKDTTENFEQPPVGNHIARCFSIIDIGTQPISYQQKTQFKRQVLIKWELCHELMTKGEFEGKPFIVVGFYTQSLSDKSNLRKILVSWRGVDFTPEELLGFDQKRLLGAPCMVNIVKTPSGSTKIQAVAPVAKGIEIPKLVNKVVYFDLDEFDVSVYESLSKKLKEKITESSEYKDAICRLNVPETYPNLNNDDKLPF